MATNVKQLSNLIYDFLLVHDKNFAEQFRKKFKCEKPAVGAPSLSEVLDLYLKKGPKADKLKSKSVSDDSSSEEELPKAVVQNGVKQANKRAKSSSDDSSDEDEPKTKVAKLPIKKQANSVSSKKESSSDDSSEEEKPAKVSYVDKVKMNDGVNNQRGNGDGETSVNKSNRWQNNSFNKQNNSFNKQNNSFNKQNKQHNQPYRRVRDDVKVDERFKDNSFMAQKNAAGSWGEKAYHKLKNTQGKAFRREKNKLKKGNYRGGKIDIYAVNSIKFED